MWKLVLIMIETDFIENCHRMRILSQTYSNVNSDSSLSSVNMSRSTVQYTEDDELIPEPKVPNVEKG